MQKIISASELKDQGILAIQSALDEQTEAVISVKGESCFVVLDIEQYQYLRECELNMALLESKADLARGRFIEESAEAHLARLESKI